MTLSKEHNGHVVKMSLSGYRNRRSESRLCPYAVSLRKALSPHCFSRLSCEMCARREYPREGRLCSAMSALEEVGLKNQL